MTNVILPFLASVLIWLMFGGVAVLWIIDGRIKKEVALHAFLASLIAWGIIELLKSLFPVARPYVVNGGDSFVIWSPTDGSFPSGHAGAAFALAVTIWLHNKKLGALFLIAALIVSISRVIANVHYSLDFVGGAVVGSLVALGVEKLHVFKLLRR